jgi:hypothetical protein
VRTPKLESIARAAESVDEAPEPWPTLQPDRERWESVTVAAPVEVIERR